ncbi:MAG: DUF3037 domain-containing protein [Calditrichia bacterium]
MSEREAFNYSIIRIIPRVDRQEFLNAGIVLFSRTRHLLTCRIDYSLPRLQSFSPEADIDIIRKQLKAIECICTGDPTAGYFCGLSQSERFSWLVAPTSTIVQMSPAHTGIGSNLSHELDALYDLLVA